MSPLLVDYIVLQLAKAAGCRIFGLPVAVNWQKRELYGYFIIRKNNNLILLMASAIAGEGELHFLSVGEISSITRGNGADYFKENPFRDLLSQVDINQIYGR